MDHGETRNIGRLLTFCSENAADHSNVVFFNAGMIHPEQEKATPFDADLRRHYFRSMKRAGFIEGREVDDKQSMLRFQITDEGAAYVREHSWWNRQVSQLGDNVLSIAVAVAMSLAGVLAMAWALGLIGGTD